MAIDVVTNDYVNCGSGASLDNIRTLSIACWINFDTMGVNDAGRIAGKSFNGADFLGWFFTFNGAAASNKLRFSQQWDESGLPFWDQDAGLTASVWNHIGLTYNGNAAGNDPILYVNGAVDAMTEQTAPAGDPTSDAALDLVFGATSNGATNYFDGRMEDGRVANVIWTPEQFRMLAAGFRGPLGGEVCHLDLMLARGAYTGALTQGAHVFNDLSGNGNDGDPFGTPSLVASTCPRIGVLI